MDQSSNNELDDSYEELLNNLQEKTQQLQKELNGNCDYLRKPKKPLTVFLRYHMEKFNKIKMKYQDWTPNKVTQFIKIKWDSMSEQDKDTYQQSYEQDMQQYDKLINLYNNLTQKPKQPSKPYLQFFSENFQIQKQNYPQLSSNTITYMVVNDWKNFDRKKKIQMQEEYEENIQDYKIQVQLQEKEFDIFRIDDYLSQLEDYELGQSDLLESLRIRYPKAPSAHELRNQEKKKQLENKKKEIEEKEKRIQEEQKQQNQEEQKQTKQSKLNTQKVEDLDSQENCNEQKNKIQNKGAKLKDKVDKKIDQAFKEVQEISKQAQKKKEKEVQKRVTRSASASRSNQNTKSLQATKKQNAEVVQNKVDNPKNLAQNQKSSQSKQIDQISRYQSQDTVKTIQTRQSQREQNIKISDLKENNKKGKTKNEKPKERDQSKKGSKKEQELSKDNYDDKIKPKIIKANAKKQQDISHKSDLKENNKKVKAKNEKIKERDQSKKSTKKEQDQIKDDYDKIKPKIKKKVNNQQDKIDHSDGEQIKKKVKPNDIEEEDSSNENDQIALILGMKEKNGKTEYLIQFDNKQKQWIEGANEIFEQSQNKQKLEIFREIINNF